MQNTRYFFEILMELEFYCLIFEKFSNVKSDGNPYRDSIVVPRR